MDCQGSDAMEIKEPVGTNATDHKSQSNAIVSLSASEAVLLLLAEALLVLVVVTESEIEVKSLEAQLAERAKIDEDNF